MSVRLSPARCRSSRQRCQHIQLHLPALDPEQALLVVDVFECVLSSIWHMHGDAIADYLGCVDPDSERMQRPYDALWSCVDGPADDDDFDF